MKRFRKRTSTGKDNGDESMKNWDEQAEKIMIERFGKGNSKKDIFMICKKHCELKVRKKDATQRDKRDRTPRRD